MSTAADNYVLKVGTDAAQRACRKCGCTQDNACMTDSGPCYWVEGDLCSACAGAPTHPQVLAVTAATAAASALAQLLRFAQDGQEILGFPFEGDVVELLLDAARMAMEIDGWPKGGSPENAAIYTAVFDYLHGAS